MSGRQLDLFTADGADPVPAQAPAPGGEIDAATLDDAALVAALPGAGLADAAALAAEAGRRRLTEAVPALRALCLRFAGFGTERLVPEQAASLRALAAIGGSDARAAVIGLLVRGVVQGPTLAAAAAAADQLQAGLPAGVAADFLAHADPMIRRTACRCAPRALELVPALLGRLEDLDGGVARAAACALGRMGRHEARPLLGRLLAQSPAEDVVEAIAPVADEACLVLLARLARTQPDLAPAALEALESCDHPRAAVLAARLRRDLGLSPPPTP
ncbi:MAG: HEAT repeat domain-containing protein [Dongiaceae bacterium]